MTPNYWFGSIFGWVDVVVWGLIILIPLIAFTIDVCTAITMDVFEWCPKNFRGFFIRDIIDEERNKKLRSASEQKERG